MDMYLAIVQTAAVVAAAAGLGVALWVAAADRRSAERSTEEDRQNAIRIANDDRRNAMKVAEMDRRSARTEAERRHRLDLLIRLSANLEHGGSHDPALRQRLGAEATALITALGPDVLPELFAQQGSYQDARRELDAKTPSEWRWREQANAVRIAIRNVAESRPK